MVKIIDFIRLLLHKNKFSIIKLVSYVPLNSLSRVKNCLPNIFYYLIIDADVIVLVTYECIIMRLEKKTSITSQHQQ